MAPVSKPVSNPISTSKLEPTAFVPPANWGLASNVKHPRAHKFPFKMLLLAVLMITLLVGGFFLISLVMSGNSNTSPTPALTLPPIITPSLAPSPSAGPGGIVVSPTDLDCQSPVTTTTITLPATVLAADQVTEMLDDKTVGAPFKVGSSFVHQPDGSWVAKSSRLAADMAAACANHGINPKSGAASFTNGVHRLQIIDADQTDLADGAYTVSNLGADNFPPPAASADVSSDPHAAALAAGVTAICADGSLNYSANRSGACSKHGGVDWWTGLVGGPEGPGPHASK